MGQDITPLVLGLGLYRSSGGPSKTVASFMEALDAPLVSFVDPEKSKLETPAIPESLAIPSMNLPGFRQFCKPSAKLLQPLEEKMDQYSLISCHSFYRYHNIWALKMYHQYKIPYWFVPHGALDPYVFKSGNAVKQIFLKCGGRQFLKDAACIIFSTEAEWMKAESILGPLNGRIIPWPVQAQQVEEKNKKRIKQEMRRQLNIPDDDPVLIYFGRIHSMKRPLETIEAVQQVDPGNLHLLIVGPDGDLTKADCEKKASDCGYTRAHVVGPCYGAEKEKMLTVADAYISLSHRENFNHSAAECLAAGIPVLLSRGNDLRSFVLKAGCGWSISKDQPEDYLSLIETFLKSDKEELISMGLKGQELVENTFSFAEFRKSIQNLKNEFARK